MALSLTAACVSMQRSMRWLSGHRAPKCMARLKAKWSAEYERFRHTPIADVPELLAAWADDDEPKTVMVVGRWPQLRRFRCPAGHHPRISPTSFLTAGCPHCRSAETAAKKHFLADVSPEIASQWHPNRNGPKLNPHNVV